MSTQRHAVNVLFGEAKYVKLVRKAAELTIGEDRRVSIAELVRCLTLSKDGELVEATRGVRPGIKP